MLAYEPRASILSYNKISRRLIVSGAGDGILGAFPSRKNIPMIGVVIPVYNEATLLGNCLEAVERAARDPGLDGEPVEVVVVLDACTDRSAAVAVHHRAQIVSLDAHCVGAARDLGASFAMDFGARWIAFTDADTVVPSNWLSAQMAAAANAVCGAVWIADWSGHPSGVRERFLLQYGALDARHIHGANLGLSAAAYRASGGFRPLPQGEDAALVSSLIDRGVDVAWNASPRVTTSARWESAVEGGLASLLRNLRETCLAETGAAAPLAA
jgi:glycosyltransferase involved in cell wall biosynthesis